MGQTSTFVPADKRSIIIPGVAADNTYTFQVQAYRSVHPDISATGSILSSTAISSAYRPTVTPSFNGDIIGTIQGRDSTVVVQNLESIASDSVLSTTEKPGIILEYNRVTSQISSLDAKAATFGIDYQTERDALSASLSTLNSYLTGLTPYWNDASNHTPIVQANFQALWASVYANVSALDAAITARPGNDGPVGDAGASGKSPVVIFLRSASPPTTPSGDGVPASWSTTPPLANGIQLWTSNSIQEADGTLAQGWSSPFAFSEVVPGGIDIRYVGGSPQLRIRDAGLNYTLFDQEVVEWGAFTADRYLSDLDSGANSHLVSIAAGADVTGDNAAGGLIGAGSGAYANSLSDLNSADSDRLSSIDAGARRDGNMVPNGDMSEVGSDMFLFQARVSRVAGVSTDPVATFLRFEAGGNATMYFGVGVSTSAGSSNALVPVNAGDKLFFEFLGRLNSGSSANLRWSFYVYDGNKKYGGSINAPYTDFGADWEYKTQEYTVPETGSNGAPVAYIKLRLQKIGSGREVDLANVWVSKTQKAATVGAATGAGGNLRNESGQQLTDSDISNTEQNWSDISGADRPADNATANTGALADLDAVDLEGAQVTGLLPSGRAALILRNTEQDWSDVSGTGRPEDGATFGAKAGVNLVDGAGAELNDAAIKNTAVSLVKSGNLFSLNGAGSSDNLDIVALGFTGALNADKAAGAGLAFVDGTASVKLAGVEAGANLTTNTSQLSDDANLGNTANWLYVSGADRPADNATANTGALADLDTISATSAQFTGIVPIAQVPSGALNSELATSITTAGTIAAWDGVTSRPTELTDGRIVLGLDASGFLAQEVPAAQVPSLALNSQNYIDGSGFYRINGVSTGTRIANSSITEADATASNLLRRTGGGGNFTGDLAANLTTDTNQLTDGAGLGVSATWAGVTGTDRPDDNADVTASAQIVITPPSAQIIYRDYLGATKAGQFDRVIVPVVRRGGADIRASDDCSYSISASGVTATVNSSTGHADKGKITVTAGGSGYIQLNVTISGTLYGPFSIPFTVQDDPPPIIPPTSGGPSGGGSDATLTNPTTNTDVKMTRSNSGEAEFVVTITGTSDVISCTAPLQYSCLNSSGSTLIGYWAYRTAGSSGSWTAFAAAIIGDIAYYDFLNDLPVLGSGSYNQTKTGLTAGDYEVALFGKSAAVSRSIFIFMGTASVAVA